jgi:uncharacterized integral membrane protein
MASSRAPSTEKTPTNWRMWSVAALALLALIVALQNSQEVRIDVLFLTVSAPLIVILLVAIAVGALIGWAAPVLRRHHRAGRQGE